MSGFIRELSDLIAAAASSGEYEDVFKDPKTREWAAAGFASVQSIRPFISMAMQMRTQAVNIVSASAQLSQKTAFVNGMVNTAVDVGMGAISGAMMAGATGLASSGAGAVVGLAIAAIGKGIGIAQEANRLNLEETVENVQLTELRTRGGVAFNQSRRGE